jgi:hypothetical protein
VKDTKTDRRVQRTTNKAITRSPQYGEIKATRWSRQTSTQKTNKSKCNVVVVVALE